MENITIKEVTLKEALKVYLKIKEFDRPEAGTVEYCNNRIKGVNHIVLAAYINNENVGYLIAYDKDGNFYCWVAAVDEKYRRKGILTKMMKIYEEFAKNHNYTKLTLKTVNDKREMLSYLVKNNWNFVGIITNENVVKNEILVEKEI